MLVLVFMSTVFVSFFWLFKVKFLLRKCTIICDSLSLLSSLKPGVTVKVKETQEKIKWTQRWKTINGTSPQSGVIIRRGRDAAVATSGETPYKWVCMQISEYTTDEIWMKAQIYATEFTITINNLLKPKVNSRKDQQDSKDAISPLRLKFILGFEIKLSDCAFITTKKYKDKTYITYKTLTLLYKIWSTSVAVNSFKNLQDGWIMTERLQ